MSKHDATGMELVGRDKAGRYVYHVTGTGWGWHDIALTHEQRVRFASLRKLAETVRPRTILNPANLTSCLGRGSINGRHVWLPVDATLSEATCRTIAHEFVHNEGLHHGNGGKGTYSRAWMERQAYWVVQLSKATHGWKVWPKVKGLRAPSVRKPMPEPTKEERAIAKRESAEARKRELLSEWERRLRLAQTKVRKYRRSVRAYERAAAMRAPKEPPPL